MKSDAFSAGVTLGGLRSKKDIKLLICYILSNINGALTKEDILTIMQEHNLANYFEINNAISELLEDKNICENPDNKDTYIATETGKMISEQLDTSLPLSVRDKAISASINLLAKIKRESDNKVSIEQKGNGCFVHFNISGGEMDLMSFTLFVPDILQANLVKSNFQESPEKVYECMLALLTKNDDLIKSTLKNIKDNKKGEK